MNRITQDTPVGTRVLVAWKHGDTFGGPRLDRTVTTSEPFTQNGVAWPIPVRLACDDQPFRIDQVYLDEPAPGTWAWACERALAGETPHRIGVQAERIELRLVYKRLTRSFEHAGRMHDSPLGEDDLTATDWEIAP